MKKKEIQKLHQSSIKELGEMLSQAKKELVELKMTSGREKTKDTRAAAKKRDEIASIATILREKELLKKIEEKVPSAVPTDVGTLEGKKEVKNEKVSR